MSKKFLKGKRYVSDLKPFEIGKVYPSVVGSTKAVSGTFKVISKGQDEGGMFIMTTPQNSFN